MNINPTLARLLSQGGAIACLLAVLTVPTFAQTNKADIVGTVTDSAGAAVPGATVTITRVDTNASRTVTTGDAGDYQAPSLDIGIYKVTASKSGYQTVN